LERFEAWVVVQGAMLVLFVGPVVFLNFACAELIAEAATSAIAARAVS
jgi:hypothetical protein